MAKHAANPKGSNNQKKANNPRAARANKAKLESQETKAYSPVTKTEDKEEPESKAKVQAVQPEPEQAYEASGDVAVAKKQGFFKRVFSKPSSAIIFIVIIVCILAAIGCAGYVVWAQMEANKIAEKDYGVPDSMAISSIVDSLSHEESIENPIDFAALQAQNPDVIAWITVPGTDVNLPILRSEEETDYYLRHDINKAYSIGGEAYIQNVNQEDFTDPVTVIYGHTFSFNDTMFTTLHKFEDPTFFEEHDTFYIYTPTRVLTYKIVSAYEFSNELITAKNLSDISVREEYFKSVLNPSNISQNEKNMITRSGSEIDIDKGRLVQLSTCTVPSSTVKRYLLNGVLENEQKAYPKGSADNATGSTADTTNATTTNTATTNTARAA